jgi:hypothetical protein
MMTPVASSALMMLSSVWGSGDGDGCQQILIFGIEHFVAWLGALMAGVKSRLRQGRIIDAIHHHETAGAGADHTTSCSRPPRYRPPSLQTIWSVCP